MAHHRTRTYLLLLFGLAAARLPAGAQAQTADVRDRQLFSYADSESLRSVVDDRISPDGNHVAYTVSSVDPKTDSHVYELWVRDLNAGQNASRSLGDVSDPSWSL